MRARANKPIKGATRLVYTESKRGRCLPGSGEGTIVVIFHRGAQKVPYSSITQGLDTCRYFAQGFGTGSTSTSYLYVPHRLPPPPGHSDYWSTWYVAQTTGKDTHTWCGSTLVSCTRANSNSNSPPRSPCCSPSPARQRPSRSPGASRASSLSSPWRFRNHSTILMYAHSMLQQARKDKRIRRELKIDWWTDGRKEYLQYFACLWN